MSFVGFSTQNLASNVTLISRTDNDGAKKKLQSKNTESDLKLCAIREVLSEIIPDPVIGIISDYDGNRSKYYKKNKKQVKSNDVNFTHCRFAYTEPFLNVFTFEDEAKGILKAIEGIKKGNEMYMSDQDITSLAEKGKMEALEFLVAQLDKTLPQPDSPKADFFTGDWSSTMFTRAIERSCGYNQMKTCGKLLDVFLKYRPLLDFSTPRDLDLDPEDYVMKWVFTESVARKHYEIMKIFFKHGLDSNTCFKCDTHGFQRHLAFNNLSHDNISTWLNAGFDCDTELNDQKNSQLSLIAAAVVVGTSGTENSQSTVELLFSRAVKVQEKYSGNFKYGNFVYPYSGSLIEIATNNFDISTIRVLLKSNIKPTGVAFEKAAQNKRLDLVKEFIDSHSKPIDIMQGYYGRQLLDVNKAINNKVSRKSENK